jgi:hypothetical protein
LLKLKAYLTQTAFDLDTDQSIYIEDGFKNFTNRGTNNDSYRVDQIIVNLAKLDTEDVLNPNDY